MLESRQRPLNCRDHVTKMSFLASTSQIISGIEKEILQVRNAVKKNDHFASSLTTVLVENRALKVRNYARSELNSCKLMSHHIQTRTKFER
jgi:hypothetical protein